MTNKIITEQEIIDFFDNFDFDLRKNHNGRWIDQKCTPDVVSFIADCILNYIEINGDVFFSSNDIWFSDYAVKNTEVVFKKPSPELKTAQSEYNKFFQQPMKMFANAQILSEKKVGLTNIYEVNNDKILFYIALREKNALNFLNIYIEKVLRDSDFWSNVMIFFDEQKTENKNKLKSAYNKFKKAYYDFIHTNTKIVGDLECGRIFSKVINPLAYKNNGLGTEQGHISKDIITQDMLMYNRNNFRDIYANKPKGITRKEYILQHPTEINEKYYDYQSEKAKKFLRVFNDQYRNGKTENLEKDHLNDLAIHIHHIFPKALYPEICYYLENLIALTPTQHFNYAHSNGHTQEINETYQHLLLLSKMDRIKENIEDSYADKCERIYEFSKFLHVLSVGFDDDEIETIADKDYISTANAINVHYVKKNNRKL